MDYDAQQLEADLQFLTSKPEWEDEEKRPDYIRAVAEKIGPKVEPKVQAQILGGLWERSKGGVIDQGVDFVARAGEEIAKSFAAGGGALALAAFDAVGITDSGSGTRLKRGVADLVDATGQRMKQLTGGEVLGMNLLPGESKQAERDTALENLRKDIIAGSHPEGLERWAAGEFDDGSPLDEETQPWVSALTEGLAKKAVAADHMGKVDPKAVRAWLESDRNPAFSDSDTGEPGPRELLADYMATYDPRSWEAFTARVSETDSQRTTRLQRYAAEGEARAVAEEMPDGLMKDLTERSKDMQTSPIDMATMMLPIFRGRAALQAVRQGSAAWKTLGKGIAGEALQEAGTEYLSDPNAKTAQILEAGALGGAGQGMISVPMAGVGALLRPSTQQPATVPAATPAPTPAAAPTERRPSDDLPPQRWTPQGATFHNMPAGAELTYDDKGQLTGYQMPTTALDQDLGKSLEGLAPELQAKSRAILAANAPDVETFLADYQKQHGNVIDADQMREMLRTQEVDDGDFTVATDPLVAALSREATRRAVDAMPQGGTVGFLAGGPASGKSHARSQMPEITEESDVLIDAPMATHANAKAAIERVLTKGGNVMIHYIHTPLEKATAFMMDRFEKTKRETNAGKLADMHFRAQQTALKIAQEYANDPRVQVTFVDNSSGKPKTITAQQLTARAYPSLDEALKRVNIQIEHELTQRPPDFWTPERQAAILKGAVRESQQAADGRPQPAAQPGPGATGQGAVGSGSSDPALMSPAEWEALPRERAADNGRFVTLPDGNIVKTGGADQPISKSKHRIYVQEGIRLKQPVSAAAVEEYQIQLPEGWTKRGEQYVPPQSQGATAGTGGPGASSLQEWGKTTFGQRLKSDDRLRASWRDQVGSTYRKETEAEWQARANAFLDSEGPEGAFAMMTDPDSGLADSDRVAIGLQLILHLDEQIRQTELAGGGDTAHLDDMLHEAAEWVQDRGTKMGQAIRVFGMWTRMSAEGVLREFSRKILDARQADAGMQLGLDPQDVADQVSSTAAEERSDVAAEALGDTTADQLAELQQQVAELRQQLAQATQEASAAQQEATQAPTPADAAQALKRAQGAENRRKRAQRDLANAEARQQRKAKEAGKPRQGDRKKPKPLNPAELATRLIARLERQQAASPGAQPAGQATKNQVQQLASDYTAGNIPFPVFQAALQNLGVDAAQAARLLELLNEQMATAATNTAQREQNRQADALARQAWDQINRLTVRHTGGMPNKPQRISALSQLIRDYLKAPDQASLPDFNGQARLLGLPAPEAVELQRLLDLERAALNVLAHERAIARLVDQLTPKLATPTTKQRIPKLVKALFKAHELGALDRPAFLKAYAEAFELPLLDDTMRAKLKPLIEAQHAAPEGFLKQEATSVLMGELSKFKGISALDISMAFWYANLLSGVGTQAVNLWGNACNLLIRVATVGVAHNPKETLYFLEGLLEGLKRGLPVAKAAIKEGSVPYRGDLSFTSAHVLELIHSDNPATWKERFKNGLSLGRYVFRVLSAGDAIFYHTNKEATAWLEAARYATTQEKANGGAFSDYLAQQLGNSKGQFQQALAQAKSELAGSKHAGSIGHLDRRAWEIMEQQRPIELNQVAERFGALGTFTQDPEGFFGQVAYATKAFIDYFSLQTRFGQLRPMQFVVPFVNIICNMTSRSLDLTPIGVLRGTLGHPIWTQKGLSKNKAQYDKYLPQEARDRFVNGILGSMIGGLVMGLGLMFKDRDDDEVPFMIYAMGPPDKNKRAQMPGGWKPYTLKIGDRYWSYAETPFAYLFAIIGNTLDYQRYDKNPDETHAMEMLVYALSAIPEVTTKTGAFSGPNEIIKMMRGEVTVQDGVSRPLSGFVPGQGFLRDLNKLYGTPKLEATSIMGAVIKDVPIVGGWANRPALNIFGEPMAPIGASRIPGLSRITGEQKQDSEILWLMRNKLWIPGMNNQLTVGSYLTEQLKARTSGAGWREDRIRRLDRAFVGVLTVEERYELVKIAGPGIRQAVAKVANIKGDFPEMTQDQMQERLNAFVIAERRKAMMKVLNLD